MVVTICNFLWKWSSKSLAKKEAVYFCIVLLIIKCMRAEIKGDEKLLIDLEWPYIIHIKECSTMCMRIQNYIYFHYLNLVHTLGRARTRINSYYYVMSFS